MTTRSPGVRANFRMDVKLPLTDAASRRRVVRNVQIAAAKEARRKITTPTRRSVPRDTGGLRRSFRQNRARRTRSAAYFTLLVYRFHYYWYFQEPEYRRFRERIASEAGEVLSSALAAALRLEGM